MTSGEHKAGIKDETVKYDLVVIGGGMAGVCAAIAAARHGCKTALLQDRPVLGGNSSSEIRMHVCGADYIYDGQARRETGILEELRLENLVRNPQRSPSLWDLLLYEWVKREPNLDLYLNTVALEPVMEGADIIRAVRARQMAAEREWTFTAKFFADCSGDGQIGAQAGADFRMGREAGSEFNEPLAGSSADAHTLGNSIMFMARDMGKPMPFVKPEWAYTYSTDEALFNRDHRHYRLGYWWIEWGGQLDTIRDNERIRDELMKIALGVWDHIKNHGDHGAQNWALEWIGTVPGKRESRRFSGDHVLSQGDLESGRIFEDEVAYGGWPIDVHPIEGFYAKEEPCRQTKVPLYSIPLRSLYSRNIKNLFFAGRNMSATHIAFASTRIMATCALTGQAIGTAAAVCREKNLAPREAAGKNISDIQQKLLADDCFLPGRRNEDKNDLALQAQITAGSERKGKEARKISDGAARPIKDDEHCWESRSLSENDNWLELRWKTPMTIGRIQLTFDSELEKRLIFTQEDYIYEQSTNLLVKLPERLVRDFEIQALENGRWRTVRAVKNNIRRARRECFQPALKTAALRVICQATYGHETARIFEVRVY